VFVRLLLVERVLPVERRVELVLRRAVLRLVLRLLFWVAMCCESLLRDVSFT
jgi:transposase